MRLPFVSVTTGVVLAAATCLLGTAWAKEDNFPTKPITLVVPFPPGGVADILARPIADKLGAKLGVPIVVENRGGASGTIGAAYVAQSRPDGYTLLFGTSNEITMSPALHRDLTYDPIKSFKGVSLVASFPNVLVVRPGLNVGSVEELVALAKSSRQPLTFASSGIGSTNHLTAEVFSSVTGVELRHIPYKGGGPALTALLGGHVDLLFATLPSAVGFTKNNQLKALMVTDRHRSPVLPDVPSAPEAGVGDVQVLTWNGVLAPHATPDAIIDKLNQSIVDVMGSDTIKQQVLSVGAVPTTTTTDEFGKLIAKDSEYWAGVIADRKITAE